MAPSMAGLGVGQGKSCGMIFATAPPKPSAWARPMPERYTFPHRVFGAVTNRTPHPEHIGNGFGSMLSENRPEMINGACGY